MFPSCGCSGYILVYCEYIRAGYRNIFCPTNHLVKTIINPLKSTTRNICYGGGDIYFFDTLTHTEGEFPNFLQS